MKNELLKYLIIVTLCYYLLKGLIYLLLWQTTKKVQENALAAKQRERDRKKIENEIWEPSSDDHK
ncbi:MAG: hypothetical protein GXY34_09725 [Syntrophomonadaceae bacterium]|nr:hypothetical protein [Syntrophomonadaceae bacterium]